MKPRMPPAPMNMYVLSPLTATTSPPPGPFPAVGVGSGGGGNGAVSGGGGDSTIVIVSETVMTALETSLRPAARGLHWSTFLFGLK